MRARPVLEMLFMILWMASFFIISCSSEESALSKIFNKNVNSWDIEASEQSYFYPIVLDRNFLMAGACSEIPCVSLINRFTGEVLWTIEDHRFDRLYYNMTPYVYADFVVLPISKELMVINWKKGEIVHETLSADYCENHIYGLGSFFFRACYDIHNNEGLIIQYDLTGFTQDSIWSIPFRNISTSLIRSPVPYQNYLVTGSIDHISKQNSLSYYHIFNRKTGLSKNAEIYPENYLGEGASFSPLVKDGASYWMVNRDLVRINLESGEEIWRLEFPHGILTSKLSMDDEKLYLPCENEQLYAVDPKTGKIIWQTKIAGTPSRLFPDEAYIYLVGGSDQNIYKINVENGSIVERWKLKKGNLHRVCWFGGGKALFKQDSIWRFRELDRQNDVFEKLK